MDHCSVFFGGLRISSILALLSVVINFCGGLVTAQNSSFSFPAFTESTENITTSGDSIFDYFTSSYQMNSAGTLEHYGSCGWIMYSYPVQMKASGVVASFKTSFASSFQSRNPYVTTCADGMVFTFTRAASLRPEAYNHSGAAFCRLDFTNSSDPVFAVEFDSHKNVIPEQPWPDPEGPTSSHIGVDLNDRSLATANICANGSTMPSFCLDSEIEDEIPVKGGFCGDKGIFAAWIDYDGVSKTLEVRVRENVTADDANKPAIALITVSNLTLDQVLDEYMYVGFSGSVGHLQETHRLHSWTFESNVTEMPSPAAPSPAPSPAPSSLEPSSSPEPVNNISTAELVAGSCAAAVVMGTLTGISVFFFFFKRQRTESSDNPQPPMFQRDQPVERLDSEALHVPLAGAGRKFETAESSTELSTNVNNTVVNIQNMNLIFTGERAVENILGSLEK